MIVGIKVCSQLGIRHTERCPDILPQEQEKPIGLVRLDCLGVRFFCFIPFIFRTVYMSFLDNFHLSTLYGFFCVSAGPFHIKA